MVEVATDDSVFHQGFSKLRDESKTCQYVRFSPPRSHTEVKRRYYSINRPALQAAVGSLTVLAADGSG